MPPIKGPLYRTWKVHVALLKRDGMDTPLYRAVSSILNQESLYTVTNSIPGFKARNKIVKTSRETFEFKILTSLSNKSAKGFVPRTQFHLYH